MPGSTQAEVISGDGASELVSGTPVPDGLNTGSDPLPFFHDVPSALEARRLDVLSGYAGLVIVDVSDPAAPARLGRLPLAGVPGEIGVCDGLVLALVSDGVAPCCQPSRPCPYGVGGDARAVLIDARDPAAACTPAIRASLGREDDGIHHGRLVRARGRRLEHSGVH